MNNDFNDIFDKEQLKQNPFKVPAGYLGLVELIVAFLLSYAFALYAERSSDILVKGTVIFFISLVILMIAMVAL